MPHRQPIFFKNGYYHVYSRGNEKRPIFLTNKDRRRFLARLKDYLQKQSITLLCYCLMSNHYHLLIRQDSENSISKFIQRLEVAYSMYFNKKYNRVGHLFQGRFKAKLIETDEYLVELSRYIHLNPLELYASRPDLEDQIGAGVVKEILIDDILREKLAYYLWSSYSEYLGVATEKLCSTELILNYFSSKEKNSSYREFVEAGITKDKLSLIVGII